MSARAYFAYSVFPRGGGYSEWWGVWLEDGTYHFVCLELDQVWVIHEASINELKARAIAAARAKQ